mmetsp:Transcript_53060/g.126239  ORF Transcript_53060/g.126239 Transcript_53060/m.126239 type:complete len:300 (+) Transcript_53060:700-1599(+)
MAVSLFQKRARRRSEERSWRGGADASLFDAMLSRWSDTSFETPSGTWTSLLLKRLSSSRFCSSAIRGVREVISFLYASRRSSMFRSPMQSGIAVNLLSETSSTLRNLSAEISSGIFVNKFSDTLRSVSIAARVAKDVGGSTVSLLDAKFTTAKDLAASGKSSGSVSNPCFSIEYEGTSASSAPSSVSIASTAAGAAWAGACTSPAARGAESLTRSACTWCVTSLRRPTIALKRSTVAAPPASIGAGGLGGAAGGSDPSSGARRRRRTSKSSATLQRRFEKAMSRSGTGIWAVDILYQMC